MSIVSPANAGSEPHTVMIKTGNTIITNVAVGTILGPKNVARFTVLKSRNVLPVRCEIIYPMSLVIDCKVPPVYCLFCIATKISCWYNTGIFYRCQKQ